jgi:paraquat-inducible protein B
MIGLLQDHKQAWQKRGSSMSASKSERNTNSNEEQSEEQFDSTSSERQQQIILLKEGVHNLQNASSTIKEVKNLGNKRMATRTPDQVLRKMFLVLSR